MTTPAAAVAAFAIGLASGCAVGPGADGSRDRTTSIVLTAAQINAGATGRALLTPIGAGRTEVAVIVSGVPPELAARPVHLYTFLYTGACDRLASQPAYALTGQVLAGSPSSTAIAPAGGPFMVVNVAPLALDALLHDGYAIRIMTSPADGNREIFCAMLR